MVTDYCGSVIEHGKIPLKTEDVSVCLKQITRACLRFNSRYKHLLGIGLAVPGLVDPARGVINYSSHLGWNDVELAAVLSKSLPIPIKVMNIVKAAALSPTGVISGGTSSTFYIRIDRGVGGAYIVNNNIMNGASWTAGEVGHLLVKTDGPLCDCGQRGCLEGIVSLRAIKRMMTERMPSLSNEQFDLLLKNDAKGSQDSIFNEIMAEAGNYLGIALAMIINLINPEAILIDCPYDNNKSFKQAAIQSAANRALTFPLRNTTIVFQRTTYASALGIAAAVILDFEDHVSIS